VATSPIERCAVLRCGSGRHGNARKAVVVENLPDLRFRVVVRLWAHHDFGDVGLQQRLRNLDARTRRRVLDLDVRVLQVVDGQKPGLDLMGPLVGLGRHRIPENLDVHIGGHQMKERFFVFGLQQ
jgi:hypothetical protein